MTNKLTEYMGMEFEASGWEHFTSAMQWYCAAIPVFYDWQLFKFALYPLEVESNCHLLHICTLELTSASNAT